MSSPDKPEAVVILSLGEVVCIIAQDGKTLTGRVARADQLHRASGGPGPWTLFMTPLEDEAQPAHSGL
jgi:hypothetical protein